MVFFLFVGKYWLTTEVWLWTVQMSMIYFTQIKKIVIINITQVSVLPLCITMKKVDSSNTTAAKIKFLD